MKSGLIKKLVPVMVMSTALAFGIASSAMADDVWTKGEVKETVTKISAGQTTASSFTGVYYDTDFDGSLTDDTLYIPLDSVFGDAGIGGRLGAQWVLRDGSVYFKGNAGIDSVAVTSIDGQPYVLAGDTLRRLGSGAVLINNDDIHVTVW